jgi:hypothetical protein
MATADGNKWLNEGLEKGFLQIMDKHFRIQYGIEEQCTDEQWEDAKKYFNINPETDELKNLKEALSWALAEMRGLGVTEDQEKIYAKAEKLI